MTRYTPTYASNAFGHAQYVAPLKNTESAAIRTLNTTGTSVEDYGRRNQKWDAKAYLQSHLPAGRPGTATIQREVVKIDDGDCAHCTNHELINMKKTQAQLDREATLAAEKARIEGLKAQEEREIARKRAEREANQHEMTSTLSQINNQRRSEWEAKKNDRTNLYQTQQLNKEVQNLSLKSLVDKRLGQQAYKDELNRKREEAIQQNINGKITDRELERRLKGLQFECYERDPIMKEETKKTGQVVKSQIRDLDERKQQEKEFIKAPPEVFYTDKELAQLKAEAEARNQEMRAHNSTYARDQLNQHFTRQQSAEEAKARQIAEERDHLAKIRRAQEAENLQKRRTRDERQQEMKSDLTYIDRQKRAEWEAKVNDKTNYYETAQLQNEISQLSRANQEDQFRQKSEYNKELSHLTAARQAQLEQENLNKKAEEKNSKGFRFECYRRDPIMKEAARETGTFQKTQKEFEGLKKQYEREVMVQPPESLVTTEHLQQLHQEALHQDHSKRLGLKSLMQAQLNETLAQKQAREALERARDAEEAARTAARNAELARIEREIKETNKKSYNQYLSHQLTDAERRKQLDEAERKYDPNVERLVEENSRIGERIVKCGKCDHTLAHERTVLGHQH